MHHSVTDVIDRFRTVKREIEVMDDIAVCSEARLVACGLLVLGSVIRDCEFGTDTDNLGRAIESGLDNIAEHLSASLGDIATQIHRGDDNCVATALDGVATVIREKHFK